MSCEIRCIGPDIYLVDGKVIWIKDHCVDASTEAGQEWLVEHATKTWTSPMHPAPYGALTCDVIHATCDSYDGAKYFAGPLHFGYLPEETKQILREEFPDLAPQI